MEKKSKSPTGTAKRQKTLAIETKKNKMALIEQLKINPIIEVACKRVGVGRSTYYEWMREDKMFAEKASDALLEGKKFMNDIAESQLIKQIGDGKTTAIIYWLKNNHPDYADKIRYLHEHEHTHHVEITPQERASIENALTNIGLASIIKNQEETEEGVEKNKEEVGSSRAEKKREKHFVEQNETARDYLKRMAEEGRRKRD